MPSFSGRRVTMTVSSTPRLMIRPPPRDLPMLPPVWLPWSSPLEPKPPPDCPAFGKPLLGAPSDPQPPTPPSTGGSLVSSLEGIVELGLSEYVVKALVVRDGSVSPFLIGFAAVEADDGVASLLTVWVCPLWRAGLDHGSSSRLSSESFLIRRDLGGEFPGVGCLGGALGVCCFGDVSSRF